LFLGGESEAGGKIKATGTAYWNSPNLGADNGSNFTAIPSGCRVFTGDFFNIGYTGYWWSSTEINSANALGYTVNYSSSGLFSRTSYKQYGFSVRCIKD
jgi:uncharacterized protein (TIGR02145 family)